MINSCAANVVAVNIDAGFKGGYLAGLIATRKPASVSGRPTTD
jgi:NCAIR mutase (PurE)-related protein